MGTVFTRSEQTLVDLTKFLLNQKRHSEDFGMHSLTLIKTEKIFVWHMISQRENRLFCTFKEKVILCMRKISGSSTSSALRQKIRLSRGLVMRLAILSRVIARLSYVANLTQSYRYSSYTCER